MAHATSRDAYRQLSDRLNRFPQGAPPSELLFRILELLFSEREAALVAQLPIRPFTAKEAARIWRMRLADARSALDELASRAILLDVESPRGTVYVLPPPMAGFFEFSMMRVRDDIDQKLLSELFYQYITVEDDFITSLFTTGSTQLGRVFVNEPALAASQIGVGRPSRSRAIGHADRQRRAPRPRLRASQRGHPDVRAHGRRCLLLPPQDGARGPRVRCASRDLHDVRRHGRFADPPWVRTAGRCGRGHGPAPGGARQQPRPVRRERATRRRVHLQLLRVLLRGDDRGPALRPAGPGLHDEVHAVRRRRAVQRLCASASTSARSRR